jgi:hypothetical protein
MLVFDGNYNIGCVNETGQRGNGQFKPPTKHIKTRWNFIYCPYCGKKIEIKIPEE